jgi:transcription elongation factor Elf1
MDDYLDIHPKDGRPMTSIINSVKTPELLPCPFCGCEKVIRHFHTTSFKGEKLRSLTCSNCSASTFGYDEKSFNDWNTRSGHLDAELKALVNKNVELEKQLKAYRCLDGDLIYITKTELAERESEKTHKAVKHGFLQAVKMLFLAKPPAPLGIDVHANNCADDYLKQLKAEVHHGQ